MRGVKNVCGVGRGIFREYAEVLIVIAVVTVGGWFTPLNYRVFGQIYLLAVIALSLRVSRWPVFVAAVVSGVLWNFVFIPPRLSFSVLHFDDSLLLGSYFAVALIGSQFTVLRSASERAKLLAESERLHRTLLDSISHELKTPIAVFRSAAEQLRTDDPVKRERLIVEIRTAAQRLDDLVGNLLNQTRLESGVLKPLLDWCDAHELVAAARRTLGERLAGRALAIEIPPDLPIFIADATLMEQAIAHLLLNAAVHTPTSAQIAVRAGTSENPALIFIAVADNGPGIPPELRDKIFDKFNRGAITRSAGLGLGLSIVRGFMQAQGGEVALESPPEGGARFTLSLPRATSDAVPTA